MSCTVESIIQMWFIHIYLALEDFQARRCSQTVLYFVLLQTDKYIDMEEHVLLF